MTEFQHICVNEYFLGDGNFVHGMRDHIRPRGFAEHSGLYGFIKHCWQRSLIFEICDTYIIAIDAINFTCFISELFIY